MPPVVWSRPESFGAWIRFDDATLIAIDAELAARLGVPHSSTLGATTRPLELHLSVTTRCAAPCEGCYLDARPDGYEPPLERIMARLASAKAAGVSIVAFGGGEPLTRRDLPAIAAEARRLGLVPVLTTSGIGLSEARAAELTLFAQVNVSHDGAADGYEKVRGFDGRSHAERALRALSAKGIPMGINVVLTQGSFPRLEETCDLAAELGAVEVQLLRYKPAGRAASSHYRDKRLTPEQIDALWPTIERVIAKRRVRVRIDCAMVPLLSRALCAAVPDAAAALEALGVFGCEASHYLGAMRADGSLAPCSFIASTEPSEPIKLGRAPVRLPIHDDVHAAWDSDAMLERFRTHHAALPLPCSACPLAAVCRGGCQVVSRAEDAEDAQGVEEKSTAFAPDPECPRVVAYRREERC